LLLQLLHASAQLLGLGPAHGPAVLADGDFDSAAGHGCGSGVVQELAANGDFESGSLLAAGGQDVGEVGRVLGVKAGKEG
jgi:hypothetical protein